MIMLFFRKPAVASSYPNLRHILPNPHLNWVSDGSRWWCWWDWRLQHCQPPELPWGFIFVQPIACMSSCLHTGLFEFATILPVGKACPLASFWNRTPLAFLSHWNSPPASCLPSWILPHSLDEPNQPQWLDISSGPKSTAQQVHYLGQLARVFQRVTQGIWRLSLNWVLDYW